MASCHTHAATLPFGARRLRVLSHPSYDLYIEFKIEQFLIGVADNSTFYFVSLSNCPVSFSSVRFAT